jgi:CHAD domain-containing protein
VEEEPTAAPVEPAPARPRVVLLPDDPVGTAVEAALKMARDMITMQQAGAVAGEVEPLHQMRIEMRRLRSLVELFTQVVHGSRVAIYRRELRWAGQVAGMCRECDVTEQLIRKRSMKLEPSMQEALVPIYEALSARRRTEHSSIVELINSKRHGRLMERLSATPIKKFPPAVTVRTFAPVMIRPIAASVARAGAKLQPDSPNEVFHRLRIRIKRLRYSLEMLDEVGGKRMRKALARLKRVQELLGMQHDVVITIEWLREFAASAKAPPQTLLSAGALIQSFNKRRDKLAARTVKGWQRLNRSGIIREALAEIARNARVRARDEMQTVDAA